MSGAELSTVLTESGLGLSVCRLLAKRMHGSIEVVQTDDQQMRYLITLPRKVSRGKASFTKLFIDEDNSSVAEETPAETRPNDDVLSHALPKVLIGLGVGSDIYNSQHLFKVEIATTTDDVRERYRTFDPDIIFIDYNLKGNIGVPQLLSELCAAIPGTPIIVTSDYASRPLHRELRRMGVTYLLNNPMSLRKVNVMVKRYLK
jgi:CheY-like chemotaxis protein